MVEFKVDDHAGEAQIVIMAAGTETDEGIDCNVAVVGGCSLDILAKLAGDLIGTIVASVPAYMLGEFMLIANGAMMDSLIREKGDEE